MVAGIICSASVGACFCKLLGSIFEGVTTSFAPESRSRLAISYALGRAPESDNDLQLRETRT